MESDIDRTLFEGLKILVVDDLPPNRLLIKKYFSLLGCEGDYAENGLEAVQKVKDNIYHLVFMDIQMPEMDGFEAVKIIRAEIDQFIPIVALSGSATEEQLKESLGQGMTGYCMKPVSFDKIKETILQYAVKKD